jgi:sugar (pentulose or hexulose) kinase
VSYDQKCKELALHFLQDHKGWNESDVAELAQDIQSAVEDFFTLHEEAVRAITPK